LKTVPSRRWLPKNITHTTEIAVTAPDEPLVFGDCSMKKAIVGFNLSKVLRTSEEGVPKG
jgi:hypothetical protein